MALWPDDATPAPASATTGARGAQSSIRKPIVDETGAWAAGFTSTKRGGGKRRPKTDYEGLFYLGVVGAGLHTGCVREFFYVPGRKFRADFAWPAERLLVEIQGGVWSPKSGHSGGTGITQDCERGNAAALAGWRVLRFTPAHVRKGEALRVLGQALRGVS